VQAGDTRPYTSRSPKIDVPASTDCNGGSAGTRLRVIWPAALAKGDNMKLGAYGYAGGGRKIRFDEDIDEWVYAYDLSLVFDETSPPGKCPRCGRMPTAEGHDACIANLPGIINACCGHGVKDPRYFPYVMFEDKTVLRGKEAEKWIKENNGE